MTYDPAEDFARMAADLEKCHADPDWCARMNREAADDFFEEAEE